MIKIYKEKISRKEVTSLLGNPFSDMIKFVVDLKMNIIGMGGELHSDIQALLIQKGSSHDDLWGANLYPGNTKDKQIEFTSMINIRPHQGNRSMQIKDEKVKAQMMQSLERLLP